MDLLDELRKQVGCSVISDLKYDTNLERAKYFLKSVDLKNYSLDELKDIAVYLFSMDVQNATKEKIIEDIQNLK